MVVRAATAAGPVHRNPRKLWEDEMERKRSEVSGETQMNHITVIAKTLRDHKDRLEEVEMSLGTMLQTQGEMAEMLKELNSQVKAISGMLSARPAQPKPPTPEEAKPRPFAKKVDGAPELS